MYDTMTQAIKRWIVVRRKLSTISEWELIIVAFILCMYECATMSFIDKWKRKYAEKHLWQIEIKATFLQYFMKYNSIRNGAELTNLGHSLIEKSICAYIYIYMAHAIIIIIFWITIRKLWRTTYIALYCTQHIKNNLEYKYISMNYECNRYQSKRNYIVHFHENGF